VPCSPPQELEAAGVFDGVRARVGQRRARAEYHLTPAGREFREALEALGAWGQAGRCGCSRTTDAGLLMWNIRRRREATGRRRAAWWWNFLEACPRCYRGARHFWLILEPSAVDVCLSNPGYDVDLWLELDTAAMVRVWLGDTTFADALRAKTVRLSGDPQLAKQFPSWLLLSHFAGVTRPDAQTTAAAQAA
jgi:hypothetical protein